jgi:hypothetical protein
LGVCDLRLSGHVTYVGYSSMESKLFVFCYRLLRIYP